MESEREVGLQILYGCFELVCHTFFFGVFCVFLPICSFVLLKKGMKSRANKFMFVVTLFMFCLSTGYWIAAMGSVMSLIKSRLLSPTPHDPDFSLPLFSAILLVNYVLTDSVVIWRAWVLCRDCSRKSLYFSIFLLLCATVSIIVTVAFRIGTTVLGPVRGSRLDYMVEITQMTNLGFSLSANICATSIICIKAWKYRKDLGKSFRGRTKVERVFVILVESGFIYCASGIFAMVASVIRLPHGTLGDIYTARVHVQFAGIYPAVVLILVSQERTLEEGVFSVGRQSANVGEPPIESMDFRENPALTMSMVSNERGPSTSD
ncbi:hypothetical protein ACEPAH_3937 [Sanghuangporus vaninii]